MIGEQTRSRYRNSTGTAHTMHPVRAPHGMSCFCFFRFVRGSLPYDGSRQSDTSGLSID